MLVILVIRGNSMFKGQPFEIDHISYADAKCRWRFDWTRRLCTFLSTQRGRKKDLLDRVFQNSRHVQADRCRLVPA